MTSAREEPEKQGIRDLILYGHIAVTNLDCTVTAFTRV